MFLVAEHLGQGSQGLSRFAGLCQESAELVAVAQSA